MLNGYHKGKHQVSVYKSYKHVWQNTFVAFLKQTHTHTLDEGYILNDEDNSGVIF